MFVSSDFSFVNLTDDKKPNRSQCSLAVGRSYRLSVRTNLAYNHDDPTQLRAVRRSENPRGTHSNVAGMID